MGALVKLKGPWSQHKTDEDRCHSYWVGESRIFMQDNDYGLNRRWYPLENVARVEDDK